MFYIRSKLNPVLDKVNAAAAKKAKKVDVKNEVTEKQKSQINQLQEFCIKTVAE